MGEGNRSPNFIILFFILTLAFSLTSAGIINGNRAISIDAYAKKSKESSEGSSGGVGGSSGGSSDGGGGGGDESSSYT